MHSLTCYLSYSFSFFVFTNQSIKQTNQPNQTQDKRLKVSLNGNRKVIGVLRGYDAFLNVVLEECENESQQYLGQLVVRGNSIVQFEALERVQA